MLWIHRGTGYGYEQPPSAGLCLPHVLHDAPHRPHCNCSDAGGTFDFDVFGQYIFFTSPLASVANLLCVKLAFQLPKRPGRRSGWTACRDALPAPPLLLPRQALSNFKTSPSTYFA